MPYALPPKRPGTHRADLAGREPVVQELEEFSELDSVGRVQADAGRGELPGGGLVEAEGIGDDGRGGLDDEVAQRGRARVAHWQSGIPQGLVDGPVAQT
jgi:hypothetical protein